MKLINRILKPFNLVIQNRDVAIDNIENNYCLLLIRQFVEENWILFDGTMLGKIIRSLR